MTTKILTTRIPVALYSALCRDAGELGIPVAAYVRRLVEREHEASQISNLRHELLARLDQLVQQHQQPRTTDREFRNEVLLLCRAIAAHLNPQLVAQVHARISQSFKG